MSATAHRQTSLPITVAQRTVLVGVETVRAKFGCDAESVFAMVDNGQLRWAFDVSLDGGGSATGIRELRFWTGEIVAPEAQRAVSLEKVLRCISGQGTTLRRGEIERQWIVSAQHVSRLVKNGDLTLASAGHVTRASVEQFLKRRHIK
jgi:hypothetical protein